MQVSRRGAFVVLALLSLQFLVLGLVQAWRDSPTYDEKYHLSGGVTALTEHQLRLTPEHPPLPKVLAALPVLATHPEIPHGRTWARGDGFTYPDQFLQAQLDAGKLQRVTFVSRLVPLAIAIGAAWALYALAAGLFGRAAGLLAGALWLTTPFVLGLGHLDGNDVGFTLAVVLAALALLRYVRAPTWGNAVIVGLAGGGALLVRITGLVVVPVLAVLVVLCAWPRLTSGLLRGGLVLVVAWAALWIGMRVISPVPDFTRVDPLPHVDHEPVVSEVARLVPWPKEFDTGIYDTARFSTQSTPGYLFGDAWFGAKWWYWPGSLLVKLPITVLAAFAGGLVCWRAVGRDRRRLAFVVLVPLAAALTAVLLPYPEPVGVRYLLPAIALGLVAASPLVVIGRRRWGLVLLAVLAAGQLAFFWQSQPHSLAWTAPPFRPGYRVATDSNLDWGQDFFRLQDWAKGKRPVLLYFGPIEPVPNVPGSTPLFQPTEKEGVLAILDPAALRHHWLAVSATALTAYFRPVLAWLRAYCPVGNLGGTILLYRFDKPPDYDIRGPDEPAAPCRGNVSRRTA
ncbi:MAG TPA: glycosyltransferase family 39 protein [Acidimicrobiia bacterium]|nr:glycosyltransferase family 39 protein [Acidimicrobiia bacterium]